MMNTNLRFIFEVEQRSQEVAGSAIPVLHCNNWNGRGWHHSRRTHDGRHRSVDEDSHHRKLVVDMFVDQEKSAIHLIATMVDELVGTGPHTNLPVNILVEYYLLPMAFPKLCKAAHWWSRLRSQGAHLHIDHLRPIFKLNIHGESAHKEARANLQEH